MTIVVLGSSGRLGRAVAANLQGMKLTAHAIGRPNFNLLTPTREELDISVEEQLLDYLRPLPNNTVIVNCAALTNVGEIQKETPLDPPSFTINERPVYTLARWSSTRKSHSVIHVSSCYVFNDGTYDASRYNLEDDMWVRGNCLYGEGKRRAENHLLHNSESYIIVRTDNFFGGIGKTKIFTEKIVDQLVNEEIRELKVTKTHYTTPTGVSSLAVFIAELAYNRVYSPYHELDRYVIHPMYEIDATSTYYDMAREIARITHSDKPILCEDDGLQFDRGGRPNVILIGNTVIGTNPYSELRLSVREYLTRLGKKHTMYMR